MQDETLFGGDLLYYINFEEVFGDLPEITSDHIFSAPQIEYLNHQYWYQDNDLNLVLKACLEQKEYFYAADKSYLLNGKNSGRYIDKSDGESYCVAITPAIDNAGTTSSIAIDYFLDKRNQPANLDGIGRDPRDVFDEIMPLITQGEVNRAKILIPFNQKLKHWVHVEVHIVRRGDSFTVSTIEHDPYGKTKLDRTSVRKINQAIRHGISSRFENAKITLKNIESHFEGRQPKHDGVNCGPIVVNDICCQIEGDYSSQFPPSLEGLRVSQYLAVVDSIMTAIRDKELFCKRNVILPSECSNLAFDSQLFSSPKLSQRLSPPPALSVADQMNELMNTLPPPKPPQPKVVTEQDQSLSIFDQHFISPIAKMTRCSFKKMSNHCYLTEQDHCIVIVPTHLNNQAKSEQITFQCIWEFAYNQMRTHCKSSAAELKIVIFDTIDASFKNRNKTYTTSLLHFTINSTSRYDLKTVVVCDPYHVARDPNREWSSSLPRYVKAYIQAAPQILSCFKSIGSRSTTASLSLASMSVLYYAFSNKEISISVEDKQKILTMLPPNNTLKLLTLCEFITAEKNNHVKISTSKHILLASPQGQNQQIGPDSAQPKQKKSKVSTKALLG